MSVKSVAIVCAFVVLALWAAPSATVTAREPSRDARRAYELACVAYCEARIAHKRDGEPEWAAALDARFTLCQQLCGCDK